MPTIRILSLVLVCACSAPVPPGAPEPTPEPVWYGATPELQDALTWAADVWCATDFGCPAIGETGTHPARLVETRGGVCGEFLGDAIAIRSELCSIAVPEANPHIGQMLLPPPAGLDGQWRSATRAETLQLIVAHELGHALGWGHLDTPGGLMQTAAGFFQLPVVF
jgi:hypothetical protein